MEILVLGGAGMLGHKMFWLLRQRVPDTWCTLRGARSKLGHVAILQQGNVLENVELSNLCQVERTLRELRPRVIVNCAGIVKQRDAAHEVLPSLTINALLPHKVAELCGEWGGRFIHFSTDCVFSGKRGLYSEDDFADAEDLYGRSKFLGEVAAPNALTLRTSMIGREIANFRSLLEWFLAQRGGKVQGYRRAFFSGVTTDYLAELVGRLIETFPRLSGVYHLSSGAISKYDLLCLLREAYGVNVEIEPQDEFFCNRSLLGDKLHKATGITVPSWPEMARQLAAEPLPYDEWRAHESV